MIIFGEISFINLNGIRSIPIALDGNEKITFETSSSLHSVKDKPSEFKGFVGCTESRVKCSL